MKVTKRAFAELAPMVVLTALFIAAPFHEALAQVAPPLGKTQSFAVLGGSSVTNAGSTVIIGDVGVSPGTVVGGFLPGPKPEEPYTRPMRWRVKLRLITPLPTSIWRAKRRSPKV